MYIGIYSDPKVLGLESVLYENLFNSQFFFRIGNVDVDERTRQISKISSKGPFEF